MGCGITFYPEVSSIVGQINRKWKNFPRRCENPNASHVMININESNDQYNCSIADEHTSNTCLNQYNLWDMDTTTLTSINVPPNRVSLSNQNAPTSIHQRSIDLYPAFPSCNRWIVKETVCSKNNLIKSLPDGGVNETSTNPSKLQ